MIKLLETGAYLVNGTDIVTESAEVAAKTGKNITP